MEKLNIEGKRSGEGFVAHKAMLVSALSRAIASRVVLLDFTLGRNGLLGYLKALGGSNVVKVVPSSGSASESQANGHKRLKVICGANTSYLNDLEWVGEKTLLTLCEVRISPSNTIVPNIGATELADTLARIIPFVAKEDNRPVLQCVNFVAKEGKLTIIGADGFRLAITSLDCEGIEGQALIMADDLKGMINALKRAKRARVSFDGADVTKEASLIIDTELIRYKWTSIGGNYPDYEKLIPTEFNTVAHFDTVEAIKAVNSLKALSEQKDYPIDLTIGDGKIVMANPDDKGQAELVADTEGQVDVRIDGSYLAQALRACGGMVEFKLTNGYSPMLFSSNGYQLVVMPMLTDKATEQSKQDREAKAEQPTTEPTEPTEPTEAEPVAEPVAKAEPKRNRKKVAVTT